MTDWTQQRTNGAPVNTGNPPNQPLTSRGFFFLQEQIMIEVKNANKLGYTTDGPALTLSHTLSSAQLTEIIKLAAAARGDDFVLDAIGRKLAESGREYICFVDSGSTPHHIHTCRSHAMAEAKRLAEKTGRCVTMLARVARVEVTNTTRVTVLDGGKE